MSNNKSGRYSLFTHPLPGDTGTGLDQLVAAVNRDPGLAGANLASDIQAGAAAANSLNHIILEAATATGAAADKVFTTDEVLAMNAWIRTNRLTEWTALHGDDDGSSETGFHRVQNDGANVNYQGQNLINTVADGIYHMGFAVQNGNFLNEDGNENAAVSQVARWLTQFYTDHSDSGTGLDRITDLVMADAGLNNRIPDAEIAAGADYANSLNHLIAQGLAATGALNDNWISSDDVVALNTWIRSDANRLATFIMLHGDDETGQETGYHLVQNDGANTRYFGQNLVNTVADGIYHIGFQIQDGRLLNEDGNQNAKISDVADWMNYFMVDQSTTGTGLDYITDHIKQDAGLARNTSAADINAGAHYADLLNHLVLDAASATGALNDGWFTYDDLVAMNAWVRSDASRYAYFAELHGDDETGEETGYHLVQNDGANTNFFGDNLINGPADSIYHFGFQISNGRFLNEDGNQNAQVWDVASWLNYFIKGNTLVVGDGALTGTEGADQIMSRSGAVNVQAGAGDDLVTGSYSSDVLDGGTGNDQLYGGYGSDTLIGGAGDDLLAGEGGNDRLDGGDGSDTYKVTGNKADGATSFGYFDTYADTGSSGTDRIVASGAGDVDIGMRQFSQGTSGIEVIDTTAVAGTARILGDSSADLLDFRGVNFLGNLVLDGSYGNDVIYGNAQDNILVGGQGDDRLDGGDGSDTYRVTGNRAGDWTLFGYFDTYADTGSSGTDRIVASGTGDVDIGMRQFSQGTSGIEVIDTTAVAGTARVLGDSSADLLDFRGVSFLGNLVLDGSYGNDVIYGNAQDNILVGGQGDDRLDGGDGSDTYRVTGNRAGDWTQFGYFDTYADTGSSGTDRIVASGAGDVDIGMRQFSQGTSGIEVIDTTAVAGTARVLGDSSADLLDFRGVNFLGNLVLDGSYGNDVIYGNAQDNILVGGQGDDRLDGGDGSDTYRVTGNRAGDWTQFGYFDTYADTGSSGTDRIVASGAGDVDIGMRQFSQGTSGIELIDTTAVAGTARVLGDSSADLLDFRGVNFLGNLVLDGGYGNDVIYGNAQDNTILGGAGRDLLVGGGGIDRLSGGDGNDLLAGGTVMLGGAGSDRLAITQKDGSHLDLYGGDTGGTDGYADLFTLMGTQGGLNFSATIHGFEKGKDHLDLSQLLDGGNAKLGLDDLLINYIGGNAEVDLKAGVHGLDGGEATAHLVIEGVSSLAASDFYFTNPALPAGLPTLDTVGLYLL